MSFRDGSAACRGRGARGVFHVDHSPTWNVILRILCITSSDARSDAKEIGGAGYLLSLF